ncbi:MAG: D-2-hydroxyacid dehydrogenase [Hyphomicrobiales bacterium]|nr:D-2-hydroxyacid dehydrogenase [Hyphomicrobiales bacterium]
MKKVVLYAQGVQPRVVELIAAEKGVVVASDMDALVRELQMAHALVIQDPAWSADVAGVARTAPNLHWVQLLTSGYDNLAKHGAPDGASITNARGAFSPAVAVHAVSLYLALLRNVPQMVVQKPQKTWDRSFAARLITPAETKVMIAGFGSIGQEIAHLLKNFGVWIVGASRRGESHYLADEMITGDEIRNRLPDMDAVFLCLPLTGETRNLIDGDVLAAMKTDAVLVNVGRGALTDQTALAKALRDGQIKGAAIDVTAPEPLPADHALWDAPNLIISPHVAGAAGPLGARRQAEAATENIRRFQKDETLENLVVI